MANMRVRDKSRGPEFVSLVDSPGIIKDFWKEK
jgi:hypothetical protein